YEFWNKRDGSPMEKAQEILKDPKKRLRKHQEYFENVKGINVGNICGSNGRKAVPLSLLGADVTVFDISEENKRYALELADFANTSIDYVVGDIYDMNLNKYAGYFDVLYLEGGILHYFNDIHKFMDILFTILKKDGRMVLSDFHSLKRCVSNELKYKPIYFDVLYLECGILHYFNDIHKFMDILFTILKKDGRMVLSDFHPLKRCVSNELKYKPIYFDENQELHKGDLAYKSFFNEQEQQEFPDVYLRYYTLSKIINSVINSYFKIQKFDEHSGWNNENIPWEFTILANK